MSGVLSAYRHLTLAAHPGCAAPASRRQRLVLQQVTQHMSRALNLSDAAMAPAEAI